MKKIFTFVIAAFVLASCSLDSGCPSYGGTKRMTKHGAKAQARYGKHRRV